MDEMLPWALSGTYLEACNCEAICPCRTVGGRGGGRSTFGVCLFALSWAIEDGRAGRVPLDGLGVVLAGRYDDDEPGSPWTYMLYLDEQSDERQLDALTRIFTGQLGGTPLKQFPWAYKPSDLRAVRRVEIETQHRRKRGWFRAGDSVVMKVREQVEDQGAVTCLIPGHDRDGRELRAETLEVRDEPLQFEVDGRCAYEATFNYSSAT